MVLEAVGEREPQAAATHPAPETLQKIAVLGFDPVMGISAAAKSTLPPVVTPEEMEPSALIVSEVAGNCDTGGRGLCRVGHTGSS